MKNKLFWPTLGSVAFFVAVFLVCNVFSFGLIFELLYDKLSELSIQIIASLASLILTIIILTLTRFSLLKRYRDAFVRTTAVIEKLTKGELNIPPVGDPKIDPKLGGLVKSIDTMAVELTKMETMRREFVSNVSHEIQSPLTSISGYAKLLEVGSSPKQREHLAVIQAESDRLTKLSENLLRLASLDTETAVLEVAEFRLDQQIRAIILAFEPEWTEKNLDLQADLAKLTVRADKNLLGFVWTNLIGNAIKFTPTGGRIEVSLAKQKGQVICRIIDSGIGIEPSALPHIFDRFYKADTSRGMFKGSGLGLAIVKKIVELHGGAVGARSKIKNGSTFTVRLGCD
jgi:signal transduction histidine kinase